MRRGGEPFVMVMGKSRIGLVMGWQGVCVVERGMAGPGARFSKRCPTPLYCVAMTTDLRVTPNPSHPGVPSFSNTDVVANSVVNLLRPHSNNGIEEFAVVEEVLAQVPSLVSMNLNGNPVVTATPQFRKKVREPTIFWYTLTTHLCGSLHLLGTPASLRQVW